VEVSCEVCATVNVLERRVDESDRGRSIRRGLLIDESHEARPHRRRKAGSTEVVGGAHTLIGADVEREVRVS